jgi:UDP-N-acetylglucosamine transferase subunit ALG13
MSRILYVWELGSGYGHVGSIIPLAMRLKSRGHDVVFALRDLAHAERFLGRRGFALLQAPIWTSDRRGPDLPISYAEMLSNFGFLDRAGLTGMVRAWRELYSLVRPDLLVIDHGPTALLAARGTGIRRVLLGTGFASPPRTAPMPSLRPWLNISEDRLVESERQVMETINELSRDLEMKPPEVLADLFEVDEDFLCTFPELDHYPRTDARYCGPFFALDEGVAPEWPPGRGERIFAYLLPAYRDFEKVVSQLGDLSCRTLIHAPGLLAKLIAKYRARNVVFSPEPVRMAQVSREADLVICHGGHGTTAASLLAGRPVLVLHRQVEQLLLAQKIVAGGLGKTVNPDSKNPSYKQLVRDILSDPRFAERAREFATRYADFDLAKQVDLIVARCEEIIRQRETAS